MIGAGQYGLAAGGADDCDYLLTIGGNDNSPNARRHCPLPNMHDHGFAVDVSQGLVWQSGRLHPRRDGDKGIAHGYLLALRPWLEFEVALYGAGVTNGLAYPW
jgi:hypothetical protein